MTVCLTCRGTGIGRAPGPYVCPECGGTGVAEVAEPLDGFDDLPDVDPDGAGSWE